MKEEIIKCDIRDCKNTGAKSRKIQVIFHTEQNEGRMTEPYFQFVEIDICRECIERIVASGKYLHAYGAMGYNEYYFES